MDQVGILQTLFGEAGITLGILILLIIGGICLFKYIAKQVEINREESKAREDKLHQLNEINRQESKEREEKFSSQLNLALQNNSQLATVITKDLPEMKDSINDIKDILKGGENNG